MNDVEAFIMQPKIPLTEAELLGARIIELERDLAITRNANEALQNIARLDRDRYAMELNERARTILDLTARHSDQMSAARRACGQLMETLKVLRALVNAFESEPVLAGQQRWPGEVFRAIQDGREILALLDFPF